MMNTLTLLLITTGGYIMFNTKLGNALLYFWVVGFVFAVITMDRILRGRRTIPHSTEEIINTIFGVCRTGIIESRNEFYIKFIYKAHIFTILDSKILKRFGIASLPQGNILKVKIK